MTLGQSIGLFKRKGAYQVTPEEARRHYNSLLSCYALGTIMYDYHFQDTVASKITNLLRFSSSHQSQLVRLLTGICMQAIADRYAS
jgi:hypothetical protein